MIKLSSNDLISNLFAIQTKGINAILFKNDDLATKYGVPRQAIHKIKNVLGKKTWVTAA